ncbi:MAG: helix-turn-helix domain-containing protein [Chloroflexi bacterium]|nr:helix-turn-helix domain-containing protein [Chloroflexota bacterium]
MTPQEAADARIRIETDEWLTWIQTLATDDLEEATREVLKGLEKRRKLGETAAALRVLLNEFRRQKPSPVGGWMTTGEAAAQLSIKSVSTVKRWVNDGILEGRKLGGRIMVSRDSVEELLAKPTLGDQRKQKVQIEFEADVERGLRALEELDWGPNAPDETDWESERKPWIKEADDDRQ